MNRLLKLANRLASDVRSDQALLVAFATERDGDALAELFRRHAPAVRGVAADVWPAAAEEVVQAVFVLLAERAGTLTGRASAAGWLFQAARRLALKARTASARRSRHEASAPPPASPNPLLDDLALREVRAIVAEELAQLPEWLRVPLVLHYWEGAAHAEAAARLGCSVSTLKRLLDAGRARLGTRLARRGLTGASVLTVLTALQSRAAACPIAAPAVAPVPGEPVVPARVEALGRSVGGTGVAKGFTAVACVLAAGAALAFGLAPQGDAPSQPRPAAATQPPARAGDPAPDALRDALPAGAVAKLGSNSFHHGGLVGRVFVTPDSRYALSIGSDAIMSVWNVKTKLWDLETGKELPLANGKLPDVPGGVRVAGVAPVGKSLALVVLPRDRMKAGEAGWWVIGAVGGETLAEFHRTVLWGRSALHPDGKYLATTAMHKTRPNAPGQYKILLWELGKKQEPTERLPPQHRGIMQLRFSPDGRYLAVQYVGGAGIEVLEMPTGKVALSVPDTDTSNGPYDCFAFSPDGKLFAKEDRASEKLRVWTLADGKERPSITCEDGNWGHTLAFDASGTKLAHLSTRGEFRLRDATTGKLVWEAACRGGFLGGFDAVFTSDGRRLVTAEREDLVVRDAKTGKVLDTTNHKDDIAHLAWARGGKEVVTWDTGLQTPGRVWDAITGRPLATIGGHADGCGAMAASPDGSLLATSGTRVRKNEGDTTVRLWSAGDGKELATFRPALAGGELGVRHLWFTHDGKTLVGLARNVGYVWDVATRRELRSFEHPLALVAGAYPLAGTERVLLSGWLPPEGREYVNVTDDPLVVLTLDLKTGKEIGKRVVFGRDGLRGASPDGRLVLRTTYGGPSNHRAEVWDLMTSRSLGTIEQADGKTDSPWVETAVFAPDGRTFCLGYSDGSVRVYEWSTRTERLRFSHGASIRAITYSPDGTRLVSVGSRWGMVWDLTTPQAAKPASDADAWAALAGNDARAGLAAVRYFADRPTDAVRYFKDRVRPVAAPDPEQVAKWIEQLGSGDFAEREAAGKQLAGVADAARSQLSAAAAKAESPEVRDRLRRVLVPVGEEKIAAGESLRSVRVVEVLETMNTPAAKELLTTFAGGAPEARLTRAAAAALKRLGSLPPSK